MRSMQNKQLQSKMYNKRLLLLLFIKIKWVLIIYQYKKITCNVFHINLDDGKPPKAVFYQYT